MIAEELSMLWTNYTSNRTYETREPLIVHYLTLAKTVVGRMAVTLPPTVDPDDLLGYAVLGLINAIERFNPERGFKFETFAVSRIRGAVIDELRSQDWLPRSLRQKAKEYETTIKTLEQSLQRTATDDEIANAMGIKVENLPGQLQEIVAPVLSLDELISVGDDSQKTSWLNILPDGRLGPSAVLDQSVMLELLAQAIDALPERERLLVTLYYHEGLTLKEIGLVMKVTESRVCQLHSQAVARLRVKLNQLFEA
jgi:RNA polymerase sigma factor FliA